MLCIDEVDFSTINNRPETVAFTKDIKKMPKLKSSKFKKGICVSIVSQDIMVDDNKEYDAKFYKKDDLSEFDWSLVDGPGHLSYQNGLLEYSHSAKIKAGTYELRIIDSEHNETSVRFEVRQSRFIMLLLLLLILVVLQFLGFLGIAYAVGQRENNVTVDTVNEFVSKLKVRELPNLEIETLEDSDSQEESKDSLEVEAGSEDSGKSLTEISGNVEEGGLNRDNEVPEVTGKSMRCIISSAPSFEDVNSKGTYKICNHEENSLLLQVTIRDAACGSIVYTTPALKPNQKVEEDYLNETGRKLYSSPGSYDAVATFDFYEPDTEEFYGTVDVEININIKN